MARLFNAAVPNCIRVASAPVTAHPVSMACWFYDTDATIDSLLFGVTDEDFVAADGWVLIASGVGVNDIYAATYVAGAPSLSLVGTYSVNTWHHACGVFSTNVPRRTAYLDGSAGVAENTVRTPVAVDGLSIGAGYDPGIGVASGLSGRVADAAIWSALLTTPEVESLAAGASPLTVRPGSLEFYCPLIRDIDDDWIGGLSLTAFGAPGIATHAPVFGYVPQFYPFPPIRIPRIPAAYNTLAIY